MLRRPSPSFFTPSFSISAVAIAMPSSGLLSFLKHDLQFKETSEAFYLVEVNSGLPNL